MQSAKRKKSSSPSVKPAEITSTTTQGSARVSKPSRTKQMAALPITSGPLTIQTSQWPGDIPFDDLEPEEFDDDIPET
jgi:hypothetical protein